MSIAALIRRMADAGASPEAIAIAVEAVEELDSAEAARKAKRAEQKRQERARRATVARQDCDNTATVADNPSPKEKSPTPPKEITPSPEPNGSVGVGKARANGLDDFKRVLLEPLGAERLDAFIATRRAKRAAFTGHAAALFLNDAAAVGLTPADAADTCISRNWITVKPEYLAGRSNRSTAGPPRNGQSMIDVQRELEEQGYFTDGQASITGNSGFAEQLSAEQHHGPESALADLRPGSGWAVGTGRH